MVSDLHVDHIGIIVDDLDSAIRMFRTLFKSAPPATKEMAEHGLRVAEFRAANVTIELLQYTGRNDDFAKGVMGPSSGVNHVSFRVADVGAAIAELERAGAKTMKGFPLHGAHGQVAFFEPKTTEGVLFEVCQPD